jgi:RNA polymerase sigma-70 factor (ECF subfamily)
MRNDARSDQQLVHDTRNGDQTAFRALVERHQRKAFAVALGIVRDHDDALDICQEAFLRVYRGLDNFDGDSRFFTWLYRILHNLAIDHLRRRRFHTISLDDDENVMPIADSSVDGDPERNLSRQRLVASLDEGLAALSPVQRAVLMLREVQGLSYKEIAQSVGCSIGTVMSRLFHARKKLLKAIEAKEGVTILAAA